MSQNSPAGEHVHDQPVLTRPYSEPDRHWKTIEDKETIDEIVPKRRLAMKPMPMGADGPVQHDLGLNGDESLIDGLRAEIRRWRRDGWQGTSNATRELLEYWSREPGEGPRHSPFFAQREAVETVVYLTEVGNGSHPVVRHLRGVAGDWNRGLLRLALRMATGTGKTLVMACLIAWYAVNRRGEYRHHAQGLARNVDRIVVICPGRTIRDRLAGLDPRGKGNVYDEWRLVPPKLMPRLNGFPVDILNWEKLQPKKGLDYAELEGRTGTGMLSRTRTIALAGGVELAAEPETLHEMWSRLLGRPRRRDGSPDRVVVLNDEGHHCWERREGDALGVWMEALHALREHRRFRLAQAIDMSATPIFINPSRSRKPEGAGTDLGLFPWVVSEFALMEAMEAGLVKIPQPPRGDNTDHESSLLNLFDANAGAKLTTTAGMAAVRQGANILYRDYEETFEAWASANDSRVGHPVLIAVVNSKENARAVFEMLGGKLEKDGTTIKSDFPLLSNVPHTGADPEECGMRTILVLSKTNNPEAEESEQIAGGALGLREVGRGKNATTEDELRDILQTVAQPGKQGGEVRCVVSVGMLTEGWDCQRVTHILGYRKFGSQLLCEQTMGRALRRRDYDNLNPFTRRDNGEVERRFPAEYATVFGVPFARQTVQGDREPPLPPEAQTEVRPVAERVREFRIAVPDFRDYTVSSPGGRVVLDPDRVVETWPVGGQQTREIRWVRTVGPVGKMKVIENPADRRPEEGIWQLAAELVQLLGQRDEESGEPEVAGRLRRGVLFGECLRVVHQWLAHENVAVTGSDLVGDGLHDLAQSNILNALTVEGMPVRKVGVPVDERREMRAAGDWRPFMTGLRHIAEVERSELNVAACHTGLEEAIANALDRSDAVAAFLRNHGPERMEIPYKFKGGWAKYVPDFFIRCHPAKNGRIPHIVLEGKGRPDERSEHKGWWTDNWWVPCADAAGAGLKQTWARREIGSATQVEAAVADAIAEVERR